VQGDSEYRFTCDDSIHAVLINDDLRGKLPSGALAIDSKLLVREFLRRLALLPR
jgi:uncharacterized protein YaiL (DUF2058 family)